MLLDMVQAMRVQSNPALRTPAYYGHPIITDSLLCPCGKKALYIVSNQPTVSAGNFCAPLIGRINRRLTVYIN